MRSTIPLLVAYCLTAATAMADPAAQARFHDELARHHYKAGRFEEALREFFLEQRISPNPRIAFNIAMCFQDLRRNEEAFQYLSEYLASDDEDQERRAYAERVVASLKPSLALVRIESTPDHASIFVDRRELGDYGSTPKVIALTPGEHQLWVELEGYRAAAARIAARRGEEATLVLQPERILGRLDVTAQAKSQVAVRSAFGDEVGRGAAPLRLNIPPGSYEVRVTSPGYLPWEGVAHVEAEQPASVAAAQQPAPAPKGSITVTSNVPGALVELNGEPVGFSPTVLSDVRVGANQLRVRAPSLVPWSGKVDVAKEENSWLTVSLEEPPKQRVSAATWITGGVGAAGLITSGVLAVLAAGTHDDFQNASPGSDRSAIRERGIMLNTATDVALISGAVATAAAVVLYFTTKEVRGRPSDASLTRSKQ